MSTSARDDAELAHPLEPLAPMAVALPTLPTIEWRIGATNPTSGERTKYARQSGQMFSGALTYSGGMFEKLRYADG